MNDDLKHRYLLGLLISCLLFAFTGCGSAASDPAEQTQALSEDAEEETPQEAETAPADNRPQEAPESDEAPAQSDLDVQPNQVDETVTVEPQTAFHPIINGLEVFSSDPSLAVVVQDYTMDIFNAAYRPYYDILGYDFAFAELGEGDTGFVLTYGVTMHYRNFHRDPGPADKAADAESVDSVQDILLYEENQEDKEASFLLRLEGADGKDTDLFTLYYITDNVASNKGLPYIPIGDILPPPPDEGTISVPVGSQELFGEITLAAGGKDEPPTLTLHQMKWVPDDSGSTDNGYYVEDLGATASYPLAPDIQISYLNGTASATLTDVRTLEGYVQRQAESGAPGLYWVYVKGRQVVGIAEQYRP